MVNLPSNWLNVEVGVGECSVVMVNLPSAG